MRVFTVVSKKRGSMGLVKQYLCRSWLHTRTFSLSFYLASFPRSCYKDDLPCQDALIKIWQNRFWTRSLVKEIVPRDPCVAVKERCQGISNFSLPVRSLGYIYSVLWRQWCNRALKFLPCFENVSLLLCYSQDDQAYQSSWQSLCWSYSVLWRQRGGRFTWSSCAVLFWVLNWYAWALLSLVLFSDTIIRHKKHT